MNHLTNLHYKTYYASAQYVSYLLTPATVSLAIPLYLQLERLKKNFVSIIISLIAGAITSMGSILAMALLFHIGHKDYVTMLPKSITTAIGMGVSKELHGVVTITVAVIIVTGTLGNVFAEFILKLFRIKILLQSDLLSAPPPMLSVLRKQWKWEKSKVLCHRLPS